MEEDFQSLLDHDQLSKERQFKRVFVGFSKYKQTHLQVTITCMQCHDTTLACSGWSASHR